MRRPPAEACDFCQAPLQDAGEAARRKAEWGRLEPALRADVERTHQEGVTARRRWAEKLREKRGLHAALGALLFGLPMGWLYLCWWGGRAWSLALLVAVKFAAGGAAGCWINARGGGQGKGALIFGGAFLVSFFASVGLGWVDFPLEGDLAHWTVRSPLAATSPSTA